MKDTFVSETRYHTKIVVITGILMISAALVLFALFFLLYNVSKKNKFDDWQENVNRLAEEVDACIQMPVNAISFSAATLNKMTSENRPHEEALSYLKSETEIYASLIPENSTGIYSYYRGEYLDGSGWLAPEGYQPTHRPWYTAAVANQGKITLVEPFLNLQTVTSMMSISKLLDDKESVVSMDIFLDSIQKSVETRMASEKCIEDAMVIDRSGAVIAHSDIALLSKNLAESGSSFDKTLAEKLLSEEKSPFQLKDKGTGYTVFFQPTNTIWTSVIVVNSRKLLRSLLSIYLAFFILLAAALAVIFLFYLNLSGKYRETDLLNCEINAIADIYEAVARINLASGDIEPIRTCPQF
ncbi:MAG: cache domain-containing protein, partial [Treponema sp.]|nr:cache domain-containing protein [Treponema sp.]